MISWYPVNDVLNTTSPTTVPLAPKDRPSNTDPSERTRRQSRGAQGRWLASARTDRVRGLERQPLNPRAACRGGGKAGERARLGRQRGAAPRRPLRPLFPPSLAVYDTRLQNQAAGGPRCAAGPPATPTGAKTTPSDGQGGRARRAR